MVGLSPSFCCGVLPTIITTSFQVNTSLNLATSLSLESPRGAHFSPTHLIQTKRRRNKIKASTGEQFCRPTALSSFHCFVHQES